MKSLTERLKEFGQRLSFMEGRTKGSNKELEDKVVTIDQYGFLRKEDKEYVAYTVKEIEDSFYFGCTMLTEWLKALDEEGYREEIESKGIKMKLTEKKTNKGRTFYSVSFPEE